MTAAAALIAFTRAIRRASYYFVSAVNPGKPGGAPDMTPAEWDRADVFGMNLPEVDR